MKILVTGANGFIGKHVVIALKTAGHEVFSFDVDSTDEEFKNYLKNADFVVHLAGINRPLTNDEFYNGNTNFTKKLIDQLLLIKRNIPIILSSSIQATLDNDYGISKKMAEDYLLSSNLPVYVYRLSNAFGKWCRPNYNSACATFCYNIAHNLPVEIRDKNYVVHYNYIDDIVNAFLQVINSPQHLGSKDILYIQPTYDCTLGHLAELLKYYKSAIESEQHLPLLHNEFELKLFKTFCNYFSDNLPLNYASDDRGSFEELYKSKIYGQISENISLPNIIKGGHYHKYKKEIFYTVIGTCEIKQRNILDNKIRKNVVNGKNPNPIDIIPGYTHSIKNIGKENSHTIMWISEIYDPKTHDTYKEEVEI